MLKLLGCGGCLKLLVVAPLLLLGCVALARVNCVFPGACTPAVADPTRLDYEDDDDSYGPEESEFEEVWDSLDRWLTHIDLALVPVTGSTSWPDELLTRTPITIKRGADGLVRVYQGRQALRFALRGRPLADEVTDGLIRLDQRVAGASGRRTPPWLKRGLLWQRDISVRIGLDKFRCLECPVAGRRAVDGELAQGVELEGRNLRRGDLVEFKDFSTDRSVELGLESGRLSGQLLAYADAVGAGNRVWLVFRRPMSQRSLDAIRDMLADGGRMDRVEIINGL